MTLGQRIREQREKFGWTQDQLAEQLGMTRGNIGSYENDRNHPPSNVLAAIADLFKTTTDYLLGRTDEPYSLFATALSKDENMHFEQFKERAVALFRQNGENITEEQMRSVMRYMEFTFLEDMEEYKSKSKDNRLTPSI